MNRLSSPELDRVVFAAKELSALLPSYFAQKNDECGTYFRGLLAQTCDSLVAIEMLQKVGPVWPLHCRWIVEACTRANALHEDPAVMSSVKQSSIRSYLLISDLSDEERTTALARLRPERDLSVKTTLAAFELRLGETKTGCLYKYYRLLCEYAHLEFYRACAYPRLGVEDSETLELRKATFLWLASSCALSIPEFTHNPPECGFPDKEYETARNLAETAWAGEDMPAAVANI